MASLVWLQLSRTANSVERQDKTCEEAELVIGLLFVAVILPSKRGRACKQHMSGAYNAGNFPLKR